MAQSRPLGKRALEPAGSFEKFEVLRMVAQRVLQR
jgi:hypothetical protein